MVSHSKSKQLIYKKKKKKQGGRLHPLTTFWEEVKNISYIQGIGAHPVQQVILCRERGWRLSSEVSVIRSLPFVFQHGIVVQQGLSAAEIQKYYYCPSRILATSKEYMAFALQRFTDELQY